MAKTKSELDKMLDYEIEVQNRYQTRFEEINKYLNWIMDCNVIYDENQLDMANNAIKANRQWATEAREILRRMMK